MIRIAHVSDSHFDERGRLDDCFAAHHLFLEQAREAGVHLIVHAGDLYDRKSTPAERNAACAWLRSAAEICPVVVVRGNHDAPGDLDIYEHLETEHSLHVYDRPITDLDVDRVPIYYTESRDRAAVIPLPWFDKSHLVAQFDAEAADQETTRITAINAAEQLLGLLRTQADSLRELGVTPILVGHVMVAGSQTSTGQTLQGTTVELSPAAIDSVGCAYAALGHIHKSQVWCEGRVAYSGSPVRQDFGETEAKGWRLVEIEDGRLVSQRFVELPVREIHLVEVDLSSGVEDHGLWSAEDPLNLEAEKIPAGSLVRVRYHIRSEDLHYIDEDIVEAAARRFGAHEVKLEAIVAHDQRVRAEGITDAETAFDRFKLWLEAVGQELSPEALERLREKLEELEGGREEVTHEAA